MNGLEVAELIPLSLLQWLFHCRPSQNAAIVIQKILAAKPILQVTPDMKVITL